LMLINNTTKTTEEVLHVLVWKKKLSCHVTRSAFKRACSCWLIVFYLKLYVHDRGSTCFIGFRTLIARNGFVTLVLVYGIWSVALHHVTKVSPEMMIEILFMGSILRQLSLWPLQITAHSLRWPVHPQRPGPFVPCIPHPPSH
jgi:hypothetical protein